jgi:heptosyltransferase-2
VNVVVIRGGGLGDFIVTLPALGMLRARWPRARITLIGRPSWAELGLRRYYLDEVISIDGPVLAPFYGKEPTSAQVWDGSPFAAADLIVNITPWEDDPLARHLRQHASGSQIILSIDARLRTHPAARQICEGLLPLGLPLPESFHPRLFLPEGGSGHDNHLQQPFWVLHPGSGSASKNWPVESWSRLLDLSLPRQPPLIRILIGEAEMPARKMWEGLISRHPRCRLDENLPLPEVAALLQRAGFYLGHDSGISHLAAAAGTRSLVLFGPTDARVWAPQGPDVTLVQAPGRSMDSLLPETVLPFLPLGSVPK